MRHGNINNYSQCSWCDVILSKKDGVANYPINTHLICNDCYCRIGPEGDVE